MNASEYMIDFFVAKQYSVMKMVYNFYKNCHKNLSTILPCISDLSVIFGNLLSYFFFPNSNTHF